MSLSIPSLRSAARARLTLTTSLRRSFTVSACRRDHFLDADEKTFAKIIEERSKDRVVLVDFYAHWCGPCKMLSPILEKLTASESESTMPKSSDGRAVDLVTVDTDEHTSLAIQFEVTALPMVVAFKDGKPVKKFVGALPEPEVRKFIQAL